jgi:hypothetical protein
VLLFGHEAVVFLLRYLVEELDERQLMDVAHDGTIANCSVSTWERNGDGRLEIVEFAKVYHLRREGAEPTHEDEVRAEPV